MKSAVRSVCLLLILMFLWTGCTVRQPGKPPAASTAAPEEAAVEIEPFDPADTFEIASVRRLLLTGGDAADLKDAADLAAELCSATGLFPAPLRAETGTFADRANGDLVLIADADLPAEAFRAVVTASHLYLFHAPDGGRSLLYGVQFLLQQLLQAGGALPCGETRRQPETPERTMMLDCARKQWSVAWVKQLIAQLSWMGFNTLELHMTEEQGIRCDIWRDRAGNPVPDCNGNDFSFLCGGTTVSWNADYPETAADCWNRDDLIELLDCARRFRIDVIPSVDLPGHSRHLLRKCEAALAGGCSFRYQGKDYTADGNERISAGTGTVNVADDFMRNLTFALTQAYADFFKAYGCDRFAVGADEVSVTEGAFAAYAAAGGGATDFDGCIRYINALCALLKDMGYTVRANNDYLFSRASAIPLDSDLQICYWQPTDRTDGTAQALLADGRQVFNCVSSYCYYVLRQAPDGADARSADCGHWDFHHATAQRIYAGCGGDCGFAGCRSPGGWNPSKLWGYNSKTQTEAAPAGAYFYLWADWAGLDTEENIFFRPDDLCLVPRMWAAGAKMWDGHAEDSRPWPAFEAFLAQAMYAPPVKQP